VLLIKPPFSVSTKEVYRGIDECLGALPEAEREHHSGALAEALASRDAEAIRRHMKNDLEKYTLKAYPEVASIKEEALSQRGAYTALMSGSGPTVFVVFEDLRDAEKAYNVFSARYRETYLTRTSTL
jgi:4-diphosphocytidyl-2-C-methyl-D-erythritol kinase